MRKEAAAGSTDPTNLAVKVRLADGSLYDQVGRLNFVDVQFNQGTDTVQVRATLPNPNGILVNGQLVTVVVETAQPQAALVIPQQAVQIDQAGRYVLKVDAENKVQVQRITVSAEHEGYYVVTNGLTQGERVITEGLVFTVEPFLSLGGRMAEQRDEDDEWTLVASPAAPCVQYEHTIVATRRGAIVVTAA